MAVLGRESKPVRSFWPALPRHLKAVNAGATGGPARYRHVVLSDRVHGASLPQIKAIDLRKTPPEHGRWLAPPLLRQ